MSSLPTRMPRPVPMWLTTVGSIFAVGHLLAIGLLALAADSGPWLMPNGQPSPAFGPEFARQITSRITVPCYFEPLRMTHNYHFESNRPRQVAAYFVVQLKSESGDIIRTLKFPDDKANPWVRHRHAILAQLLADDVQVQGRTTEVIGPAGAKARPTMEIWEPEANGAWKLAAVDVNKVPKDRPVFRPSDRAKVLADAYMRFLCREYKAKSAVLVRHSREPIEPAVLIAPDQLLRPELFNELKSTFGEFPREQRGIE